MLVFKLHVIPTIKLNSKKSLTVVSEVSYEDVQFMQFEQGSKFLDTFEDGVRVAVPTVTQPDYMLKQLDKNSKTGATREAMLV